MVELIETLDRRLRFGELTASTIVGSRLYVDEIALAPPPLASEGTVVTTNYDELLERIVARIDELSGQGAAFSESALYHEVAHATLALDASSASQLFRVVRAWQTDADGVTAAGGTVPLFVVHGQRRFLAQRAWYRNWSVQAIPAVILGLGRERVLAALRERIRELRATRPRPLTPQAPRRLIDQLKRLAYAIVPHAPPRLRLIEVVR
jgi:hypothetical protein